MGFFSDATVDALLDLMFGSGHASGFPSSYDVALSTTQPTDNGSNVTEPADTYVRQAVTNNTTNFPAASARQKSNGTAIAFPQPMGAWGVVGYFAIYDHGTSTFRGWGALGVALNITGSSLPPTFAPGQLVITAPG